MVVLWYCAENQQSNCLLVTGQTNFSRVPTRFPLTNITLDIFSSLNLSALILLASKKKIPGLSVFPGWLVLFPSHRGSRKPDLAQMLLRVDLE